MYRRLAKFSVHWNIKDLVLICALCRLFDIHRVLLERVRPLAFWLLRTSFSALIIERLFWN